MEEYGVTNKQQAVLPISIFLIGYVLGPLFFGPLSEQYGRKMIVIVTFISFIIFTMACALTPSWTAFIIFRLFCGITASAPIVVVGGVYADIYDDPDTRGLAMAIFMAVSLSSSTVVSINIFQTTKITRQLALGLFSLPSSLAMFPRLWAGAGPSGSASL
jgi:MFS family permease